MNSFKNILGEYLELQQVKQVGQNEVDSLSLLDVPFLNIKHDFIINQNNINCLQEVESWPNKRKCLLQDSDISNDSDLLLGNVLEQWFLDFNCQSEPQSQFLLNNTLRELSSDILRQDDQFERGNYASVIQHQTKNARKQKRFEDSQKAADVIEQNEHVSPFVDEIKESDTIQKLYDIINQLQQSLDVIKYGREQGVDIRTPLGQENWLDSDEVRLFQEFLDVYGCLIRRGHAQRQIKGSEYQEVVRIEFSLQCWNEQSLKHMIKGLDSYIKQIKGCIQKSTWCYLLVLVVPKICQLSLMNKINQRFPQQPHDLFAQHRKDIDIREVLQQIIQTVLTSNIFKLRSFWNTHMKQILKEIKQNEQMYSRQMDLIAVLVKIYQYRSFRKKQLYDIQCKEMDRYMEYFRVRLRIVDMEDQYNDYNIYMGNQSGVNQEKNQEDFLQFYKKINKFTIQKEIFAEEILLSVYLKQSKSIYQGKKTAPLSISYKNTKTPFHEFITNFEGFTRCPAKALESLSIINHIYPSSEPRQLKSLRQQKQNFFNKMEYEMLPDHSCLGCTKFLYHKMNFYDISITKTPLICYDSAIKWYESNDDKEKLLEDICALLNSEGGIIMFGIKKEDRLILAMGNQMSQSLLDKIKQSIMEMLKKIGPLVNIEDLVRVDFVPVMNNPYQIIPQDISKEELKEKVGKNGPVQIVRPFLPGVVMTRIRVCPLVSTHLYFVKTDTEKMKIFIRKNGETIQIKQKKMAVFIKNKMKRFYTPPYQSQDFNYIKNRHNIFNHECEPPLINKPYDQNHPINRYDERMKKESTYKNMYIILAEQNIFPRVKRKMGEQKPCSLEIKFANHQLRTSRHCSVLFTNMGLKEVIDKAKEIDAGRHPVLTIEIYNRVKLKNRHRGRRPRKADFQRLKEWFLKEFPFEELKMFEYLTVQSGREVSQFYIESESRTSALFVYYVINQFNEKAVFLRPKGLKEMQEQEMKRRWRLLYTSSTVDID